jgi:hypothetical protein
VTTTYDPITGATLALASTAGQSFFITARVQVTGTRQNVTCNLTQDGVTVDTITVNTSQGPSTVAGPGHEVGTLLGVITSIVSPTIVNLICPRTETSPYMVESAVLMATSTGSRTTQP